MIEPPAVLREAGKAHFNSRLADIAGLDPVKTGTVLIGDSITEAWMWQRKTKTYPFLRPVANHGVGWDVTEGAVARLPLVEPSNPDQIFIKIGTNDISLGVPLEEMALHFELLLSELTKLEPQAKLYVQSVLPREADKLDRIAEVNSMQAKLARAYNAEYIDLTSTFAQADGTLREELTGDGLHLNAAGYAVWGEALSPYVK
ncbi:MAG: GDSL-type esterase/lipase family protein [Litorimonas sp.]